MSTQDKANGAVAVLMAGLLVLPVLSGCSSTSERTTTTETTTPRTTTTTETGAGTVTETTPASTTSTTMTTRTQRHGTGLLGGIFQAVGTVLAFPFKLVAAVIETVF